MAAPSDINLYDFTIPPMIRMIDSISLFLKKSEEIAQKRQAAENIHTDLTSLRLHPEMHAFPFQIQATTKMIWAFTILVVGQDFPKTPDNEVTFQDFLDRLAVVAKRLREFKREDFVGLEKKEFDFKGHPHTGLSYTNNFILPSFYFHATTSYNLLRQADIDLGKMDYLGGLDANIVDPSIE